ncbi:hypothetical protein J6590_002513 [Homalodisca vitripennis]|nr:hypothetical protein J6590_002513 [Homalodisca vitripennis]
MYPLVCGRVLRSITQSPCGDSGESAEKDNITHGEVTQLETFQGSSTLSSNYMCVKSGLLYDNYTTHSYSYSYLSGVRHFHDSRGVSYIQIRRLLTAGSARRHRLTCGGLSARRPRRADDTPVSAHAHCRALYTATLPQSRHGFCFLSFIFSAAFTDRPRCAAQWKRGVVRRLRKFPLPSASAGAERSSRCAVGGGDGGVTQSDSRQSRPVLWCLFVYITELMVSYLVTHNNDRDYDYDYVITNLCSPDRICLANSFCSIFTHQKRSTMDETHDIYTTFKPIKETSSGSVAEGCNNRTVTSALSPDLEGWWGRRISHNFLMQSNAIGNHPNVFYEC